MGRKPTFLLLFKTEVFLLRLINKTISFIHVAWRRWWRTDERERDKEERPQSTLFKAKVYIALQNENPLVFLLFSSLHVSLLLSFLFLSSLHLSLTRSLYLCLSLSISRCPLTFHLVSSRKCRGVSLK